jgi:hypothetical protein
LALNTDETFEIAFQLVTSEPRTVSSSAIRSSIAMNSTCVTGLIEQLPDETKPLSDLRQHLLVLLHVASRRARHSDEILEVDADSRARAALNATLASTNSGTHPQKHAGPLLRSVG